MSDILTNKTDQPEFAGLKNLIEVSPRFEYKVEKLPEDEKYMADGTPRFVVSGPIQKAEVLNQNKRVYPYNILKREADNYQRLINENRALGELDHPSCIRRGAKILTRAGWKNFEDISDDEIILTLNRESGKLEEQQITRKVNEKYNGPMYHFKNIHIDTMVTPTHRFWLINKHGNGEWATAEEIYSNRKKYSKYYIPKKSFYNICKYGIAISKKDLKIDKVDYNDNVFCVTVPNETFFAMDNGKTYLSGNSSIIELRNVSHVIRKLWWDDKVLYGRIEILPTPSGNIAKGLINSGITLGISSRGVGSVKNVGGVDVVQDDFILICWDLVSEPSTPGAFLFKEGKEETYSRALIENTMRHWGEDFKDSVPTVFKGIVQNQYNKKICDKIDEVFGIYNSLKYKK